MTLSSDAYVQDAEVTAPLGPAVHHRTLIVFNPKAGQAELLKPKLEAAAMLWREAGWQVELRPTRCAGDATVLAKEAAAEGFTVVAAAGGDGTVNEVVNGLVGTETALAVLPCGTVNIWAREMGLSMDIAAAAAAFLAAHRRPVDLGVCRSLKKASRKSKSSKQKGKKKAKWVVDDAVGDRYFLLMASAGFDAAVTAEVDLGEKRRFGAIAYVKRAAQMAWRYQGTKTNLRIDGKRIRGRVLMVVIGNSQLYGGVVKFTAHALVDDGYLDVCVIRGRSLLMAPSRLVSVFTRFYNKDPKVRYYRAQRVEIRGKKKKKRLPVQVDGDYLCQTPMTFEVVNKALWALVPLSCDQSLWSTPVQSQVDGPIQTVEAST